LIRKNKGNLGQSSLPFSYFNGTSSLEIAAANQERDPGQDVRFLIWDGRRISKAIMLWS
jgi:hypothetical protein